MVAISKYDKRVWENYVSSFEEYTLYPRNISYINDKSNSPKKKIGNKTKNFKKKKLGPEKVLDLHGYTLYSAKLLLHKFVTSCYEKNIRNILIITGKGQNNKGVLKEEVPRWLNDKTFNKFVVNFSIAPKFFGGEGALLVKLKNRFKKL